MDIIVYYRLWQPLTYLFFPYHCISLIYFSFTKIRMFLYAQNLLVSKIWGRFLFSLTIWEWRLSFSLRPGMILSNPRHLGSWTTRYLDISVLDISVLTWTSRYWTVQDLDETIFGTYHNCLVLINCQYFCSSSSLIYDPKVDRYVFLIMPV